MQGGWTSVAIAASRGYNSIVDLLLQHGADVEIRSEVGPTDLDMHTSLQSDLYHA